MHLWLSGPWFNIKMSSYQYRKSHCGAKTILRPSYLHNGISYTGKISSLYWIGDQNFIIAASDNGFIGTRSLSSHYLSHRWPKSYRNKRSPSVFALSAGPRPSATKNRAGPASFPFGPASFSSFSCLNIFKDEFRAGKFWNLNAKTAPSRK